MTTTQKNQSAQRILVVAPAWIGDMIMAQSFFKSLKAKDPYCQIEVLAPSWTFSLIECMPEVDKALTNPFQHGELALTRRIRFGRSLQEKQYRSAYVLRNSWKSALIPYWANIPKRTGWLGEYRWGLLNDVRYLDAEKWPRMVDRFVALAQPAGYDCPEIMPYPYFSVSADTLAAVKSKFSINTDQQAIALCPGAEYGPSKRWPVEYYAQLAQKLQEQSYQVWLFGSGNDQQVAQAICQQLEGEVRNFTGQTGLKEAIALLAMSQQVVTNDSGLMHVAAALDKPLVAIYGSSSPYFTPPLSTKAQILYENITCSPCFKRECPLTHHLCMRQIVPDKVVEALDRYSSQSVSCSD